MYVFYPLMFTMWSTATISTSKYYGPYPLAHPQSFCLAASHLLTFIMKIEFAVCGGMQMDIVMDGIVHSADCCDILCNLLAGDERSGTSLVQRVHDCLHGILHLLRNWTARIAVGSIQCMVLSSKADWFGRICRGKGTHSAKSGDAEASGQTIEEWEAESDLLKRDFVHLQISYKSRGGNPISYWVKLLCAIIGASMSIMWILHICIFE